MFARLQVCIFVLLLTCFASPVMAQNLTLPLASKNTNPKVLIDTNYGKITLELFADKAPASVNNFLGYVQSGYYNNTIIHRVSKDFIIQGGAYNAALGKKPQRNGIALETVATLKNRRGTIAAARKLSDSNSASSEFFINLVDNPQLDFQSKTSPLNQGFAVFGQIVQGIEVIDKIRKVKTESKPGFPGLPTTPIVIVSISRVSD